MKIRQPIVTVCGHVDHGKTSILDCLRGTSIQEGEKGGITQKISFTSYPLEQLKKACPLIEQSKIKLNIPGFLLIDTPGHAAFINLRKRGGSLADLAVLVIDVNEGIKPQTAEVIKILKHNKTPFIIALNKIDNIGGWRATSRETIPKANPQNPNEVGRRKDEIGIKESIESQAQNIQNNFNEKYMTIIGSLNSYGFDADLYYNIKNFTKKIAMIPTSAKTKQGIPELILTLCGLSQKFLTDKLKLGKEPKGVMLEIKKEKSTNYNEAILYDGELKKTNEIAIASFEEEPIISKIRILEEIKPLSTKFETKSSVQAATGIRMQLVEKENILPGMPFEIYKNNKQELKEKFSKQIGEVLKTDKQGIIVKADSLGSLEALLVLLKQNNIPIAKARIGSINKTDIISAKANLDINELDALILGFNVSIDEDAKELAKDKRIKIFTDDVVYKLIEDILEFRQKKAEEIEKKRLMELATISKLKILHEYVFRNTNPTIFGAKVEAGKLRKDLILINEQGEKVGKVKAVQHEKKTIDEASLGMEIALSISGTNYERQLKDKNILYSNISESQFRKFKKNKDLLSSEEIKVLSEIENIKRKEKAEWGM